MMNLLPSLLATLFLLGGGVPKLGLPPVDPKVKEELKAYLRSHAQTPEDYLLSKFKEHDVVFLGENHYYKHNLEFVQKLIPRLYDRGIFTLATEFARREDQPLIDRLLNAPRYDEALARQITFNQYVLWGYQEYVDVFKAAWQLNRRLPRTARKFRILGVNCSPDWSVVQKEEDLYNNLTIMTKVWRGCSEADWAKVILDEVVAKGEKALIYSGTHHAFTEYRQPKHDPVKQAFAGWGDVRMGNHVYRAIGKRAITIYLHGVWHPAEGYERPSVYAADGYIDAVMAEMEPKLRRVGFDTRGSPFGELPGETSIYKYGYEKFTLGLFCDGYIFQKPLREYEGVTPIKGFINAKNLAQARLQAPEPQFRNASPEEFYRETAAWADLRTRLARFR